MRIFSSLLLLLCLIPLGAQDQPVRWSATAVQTKPAVFRVLLTAAIAPGWHLYSLKEIPGGPKATRIDLIDPAAWEWAAPIESPEPERAEDSNFSTEVEFYSSSVDFTLQARRKQEGRPLALRLRYQCCTDKECLPPRSETVTVIL